MKKKDVLMGLLVACIVAFFSFLASQSPDGLERVAEDKGFLEKATDSAFLVFGDYAFPGVANEKLSVILAGITGVLIIFAFTYLFGRLLRTKHETRIH